MSSFLKGLASVGRQLWKYEPLIALGVGALPGGAAAAAIMNGLYGKFHTSISGAEAANPADGAGPQKSMQVVLDIENEVLSAGEVLGLKVTWDADKLKKANDAVVAWLNAVNDFKNSIHYEKQ